MYSTAQVLILKLNLPFFAFLSVHSVNYTVFTPSRVQSPESRLLTPEPGIRNTEYGVELKKGKSGERGI